jgi:molybdopterin-containing oxidoreductase family iron-sulfur binding subunit
LHPYLSTSLHDGRGANLPWLQELPDPLTGIVYNSWVELNPVTAETLGLSEGDVVTVQSLYGSIDVPVFVYPAIMPNVVAIPFGQGHTQYGRYARDRGVNAMQILAPRTEPATGALAWGATRVLLAPTGRHIDLIRVAGESRELGREIVQIADAGSSSNARLNSIPITVVRA